MRFRANADTERQVAAFIANFDLPISLSDAGGSISGEIGEDHHRFVARRFDIVPGRLQPWAGKLALTNIEE
jgi:hypothetical protein